MRFIKAMVLFMVLFLAIGGVAFCGSISGTVVDKVTGELVDDAEADLYKWDENNQCWYWVGDDGDEGYFSFSNLEAGTYIIRIYDNDWWDNDFFDIDQRHFPQWYDGIPGNWENKDYATKIILTDSKPDKSITVNLEPSPVSVGLSAEEEIPTEGGKIRYGVAVKNWTDKPVSLKAVIWLKGEDYNGMFFRHPLSKVIQFNLPASETKSALLNLSVPAFAGDGFYWIEVDVYPSDKYPWLVYSQSGSGFEKEGTKLFIITDKKKLREIYLKRIPKVLK